MTTMRAAVLDGPGPPERFEIRRIPVPEPAPGWALIKVEAFGLNRSELHTRLGLAEGVTFPRVLGIEATGLIAACPGDEFEVGQQVVALMGGMGRQFDGSYAEYTCVPVQQVTTRSPEKVEVLRRAGVDHVLLDDGNARAERRRAPRACGPSDRNRQE